MNAPATRSRSKSVTVESSVRKNDKVTQVTPQNTVRETSEVKGVTGFVTVEGGITKNLGDYNSARIGVVVSLPCEPTVEGARKAYSEISKLVDKLMNEEYDKVMSTEE
jgi:hypothetical protein